MNRQYRGILSFNTASLPDNAIILSAVLKIKQSGAVIVADVYAAGEDPEPGVSGQLIVDSLETRGGKVLYVQNRAELARSVIPLLEEGDTLITMGAGDVTQCAREILELLEE